MFASQEMTVGQLNAVVKKLGGQEGTERFLRGELAVSEKSPRLLFVDRSVKPTYPEWMKEVLHPELEHTGPSHLDPALAPLYFHLKQQNGGVLGAAVSRGEKQSYVVASSAVDGASPATMTYGVPGGGASRHVVFDAPEDSNGESVVTTAVSGSRCVITIQAGKGFAGRPLMFVVAGVNEGCMVTESVEVTPVGPSGAGGSGAGGIGSGGASAVTSAGVGGSGGAGSGGGSSGCGCRVGEGPESGTAGLVLLLALASLARRKGQLRNKCRDRAAG